MLALDETQGPEPDRRAVAERVGTSQSTVYLVARACSIFVWAEPLRGWRRACAESTRTRLDCAHDIDHLLNVEYPEADKVVLATDNFDTHSIASLGQAFPDQAFPPEKAYASDASIKLRHRCPAL